MTSPIHVISSQRKQVLLLVNPKAGSGARQSAVEELTGALAKAGLRVETFTRIEELAQAAREGLPETLRAVVAAGGDGTVRLVAQHVPPEVPIAILPLGTENLLSKYLDVPSTIAGVCDLVEEGVTIQLDAGEANGRLFTLMVSSGLDADVVRRLHSERKGHINHFSYVKPLLDSIRNYGYPLVRVYYRSVSEEAGNSSPPTELTASLSGRWVFVMNLPRYAGGLNILPDASGSDGLLDVCTFKEGSLWNGLLYLGGVLLGQHQSMQGFSRVKTSELRIESDTDAPFQLDGDPGGNAPLTIRSLPKRLRMVVNVDWALRHGFELTHN